MCAFFHRVGQVDCADWGLATSRRRCSPSRPGLGENRPVHPCELSDEIPADVGVHIHLEHLGEHTPPTTTRTTTRHVYTYV